MNKLKMLIRSLSKQKLSVSIMLFSLAVGFACINLIATFIQRELTTDNFHVNNDRIFAMNAKDPFTDGSKMSYTREGSGEYIKENFSQVEDFCRADKVNVKKVKANGNLYFDEVKVITASPNFFEFFTFNLTTNNPKTVLESVDNIAISKELAVKYFGVSDPLGEIITLEERGGSREFTVSGVFEKPKTNSSLNFDLVTKFNGVNSPCYLMLTSVDKCKEVEDLLKEHKKEIPAIFSEDTPYEIASLKETYFSGPQFSQVEKRREKTDLWIACIIGGMVLLIALFNYMGLLNNRFQYKSKEYALRRINGSSRKHLLMNFMSENTVLIVGAFALSFILILWMAPFFNQLTGADIDLSTLLDVKSLLLIAVTPVFTILVTLVYTAFVIKFRFKSKLSKDAGKIKQLPVFNILQLAASIILVVGSVTIIKQMNYITNKPLGINKDVIQVKIPHQFRDKTEVFKQKVLESPLVENATAVNFSPFLQQAMVYMAQGVETPYSTTIFQGDENYMKVLGIEVVEGDNFSENPAVNKNKIIINRALANLFPHQDLIGKSLPGDYREIIGITDNFHYSSLKSPVLPALITCKDNGDYLLVDPANNNLATLENYIAQVWTELIPDYPVDIESMNARYEWVHRENKNYLKLVTSCCAICVFLAMIGLFAVSVETTRKRIKEVGIRKVNGAKVLEIIALLNNDFIVWVSIVFIIACPVSLWLMQKWLIRFTFQTSLNWWIFAIAGFSSAVLALLTVSYQANRAARRNPVEALRYE